MIDITFLEAQHLLNESPELVKKTNDMTVEEKAIHLRAKEEGYWAGYHAAMEKVRHNMQMAIIGHVK